MGRWWRWALVSPHGVVLNRMVGVSASVNLPLHHKVQKFSSGTGSPGWSRKKGSKTVVVVVYSKVCLVNLQDWQWTNHVHSPTVFSQLIGHCSLTPFEQAAVKCWYVHGQYHKRSSCKFQWIHWFIMIMIMTLAPRSRQITTPAPHHSIYYRTDAHPDTQPTASKHSLPRLTDWVKVLRSTRQKIGHFRDVLPGQTLGIVLKKLNVTQQKQTNKNQNSIS